MSRKKRFNPKEVLGILCDNHDKEQQYYVGAYIRLSREDNGKLDGFSLQNQQNLLMEYIYRHHDLQLYRMYIDNGYSGTNFERPAFEAMMQDVRKGKINCIMVKDLSRLGRNYLETGNYIEQIFPLLGVRFISITDGYDSICCDFTEESFFIPLKNIINEGYAKDLSIKISTALDIQKKQGKFLGRIAPYGYEKTPNKKLVIDLNTYQMVQRIFAMRIEGNSLTGIAQQMNNKGILSPMQYNASKGNCFKHLSSDWNRTIIKRILVNPVYLGWLVYGKTKQSFAKNIPSHTLPQEQWKIVKGAHEPIISQQTFDAVQRTMRNGEKSVWLM